MPKSCGPGERKFFSPRRAICCTLSDRRRTRDTGHGIRDTGLGTRRLPNPGGPTATGVKNMTHSQSSTSKQASPMLLVVDDDSTARYGMRRALEGRYRVLEAESVPAARLIMAQENPHLLLLDIEMPEESGLDYLRELKAQAYSPAVIMVTAYGSEKIAVEAMKSGAYDYLPKPFEVDELRLVVERALDHLALAEENLRLKRQLVSEGQFGAMIGSS